MHIKGAFAKLCKEITPLCITPTLLNNVIKLRFKDIYKISSWIIFRIGITLEDDEGVIWFRGQLIAKLWIGEEIQPLEICHGFIKLFFNNIMLSFSSCRSELQPSMSKSWSLLSEMACESNAFQDYFDDAKESRVKQVSRIKIKIQDSRFK